MKTSIKQMFNVTCSLTGVSVKVRKPVYLARLEKVKTLIRRIGGKAPTTEEAIQILTDRYVSAAARKEHNVDMIGNSIEDGVTVAKQTRKVEKKARARKSATKASAPVTATPEVVLPTEATETASA